MKAPEDFDTPHVIDRPVLNPANRAVVMVLHNLALQVEAFPRALLDIAKAIQLAEDEMTAAQVGRIAKVIRENGAQPLLAGAQAVEESHQHRAGGQGK